MPDLAPINTDKTDFNDLIMNYENLKKSYWFVFSDLNLRLIHVEGRIQKGAAKGAYVPHF